MALVVKNPLTNAGDTRDTGLIPGWGRSPGGGNGNPFQYCLENATEEPGVMKSWTQLSTHTHTLYQYCFIMTDVPQWCMVLTTETIACGLYDNCLYYPHKLFVNLKLY